MLRSSTFASPSQSLHQRQLSHTKKLKFAKRKLRVQRCKTLPGVSSKTVSTNSHSPTTIPTTTNTPKTKSRAPPVPIPTPSIPTPITIPKGDPSLGDKLAHLPKAQRKQIKSADADRVARRLAKKKAKALADKGVKSRESGKDRERVRKRAVKERNGAPEKKKAKTGRVRSGNALAKMNRKK